MTVPEAERYLELDLPEEFIVALQDRAGHFVDYGRYWRHLFSRMDDGSYVCAGHGGSPTFLRCIHVLSDWVLECVDGNGDTYLCKLVPFEPAAGGAS